MASLKAMSINAMGLHDNRKRRNIFQWLKTQNLDIIFLQETHIYQKKDIDIINNEWNGKHFWAYSSFHSAGVGVLFSPKFSGTIDEIHICSNYEGRLLYVPVSVEGSDIQLLNVYAPNAPTDRRNFFDSLPEYIKGHTPLIIRGDWNCVENTLLDKFGGDHVSDPGALASLQELLGNNNAVDIYRKFTQTTDWSLGITRGRPSGVG